ncbi:MAG TPA: hypothetical protein VGQ13_04070 [Nitrososphaera sp.]|nr:hypothetical protein [Nitrososphaera sp.]
MGDIDKAKISKSTLKSGCSQEGFAKLEDNDTREDNTFDAPASW